MWKSKFSWGSMPTDLLRFVVGIACHSYVLIRLPLPVPLLQNIFLHHCSVLVDLTIIAMMYLIRLAFKEFNLPLWSTHCEATFIFTQIITFRICHHLAKLTHRVDHVVLHLVGTCRTHACCSSRGSPGDQHPLCPCIETAQNAWSFSWSCIPACFAERHGASSTMAEKVI